MNWIVLTSVATFSLFYPEEISDFIDELNLDFRQFDGLDCDLLEFHE